MTYQVIKMYGDCEPWWFLDGWEKDITDVWEFSNYEDALLFYKEEYQEFKEQFPKINCKWSAMSAFWNTDDLRWCEECAEDLQQYHSLLILSDWQKLPDSMRDIKYS